MNVPNLLSGLRILLTAPLVAAILAGSVPAAAVVLAAALLTDFLDGWFARTRGEITTLGRVLDPLADKILAAGALVALARLGRVPAELVFVVIARDLALLAFGWLRVRAGAPVPSASPAGKTAFALLGVYLAGGVLGVDWPGFVPALVGSTYAVAGLTYAGRLPGVPGLPLGRTLEEKR